MMMKEMLDLVSPDTLLNVGKRDLILQVLISIIVLIPY